MPGVQTLQQVVGGEHEGLVPPLGSPVPQAMMPIGADDESRRR
jgi:hypothetical protein